MCYWQDLWFEDMLVMKAADIQVFDMESAQAVVETQRFDND